MRNTKNELKLLVIFVVAPQIFAYVFDFKAPDKNSWFSLTSGQNNTPVVWPQCSSGAYCSLAAASPLLDSPKAQQDGDPVFAFVNRTDSFALFYRSALTQPQNDVSFYSLSADNNTLDRTAMISNILTTPLKGLITDPYTNNMYLIYGDFMYRYPMNQMNNVGNINNFESRDKMGILNDAYGFNYYVVNERLFRLQHASTNQANIIIQTIPATLNGTLSDIPSKCIGQLFRPNTNDYSSIDNFQISVLLQDDYDAVFGVMDEEGNSDGRVLQFVALGLALIALALLYQV